jgi:hypothetical protein
MTAAEFKKKWSRYQGKETSAYQGHFDDLCRLLGQPTPAEADPSGADFFCFQKRVVKDAELFEMHETPDASEPTERGFADVWKKSCFAWEYKGKKKNLDEAYKQLLRYAKYWWLHVEPRPGMLTALAPLPRFLTTVRVSKFRLFIWHTAPTLPDSSCFSFARSDDYFLGVLHLRFHEAWALKQGTRLETRPRYTPNTCFETFPFPFADDLQPPAPVEPPPKPKKSTEPNRTYAENLAAKNYYMGKEEGPQYRTSPMSLSEHRAGIAAAAKELNVLRERWLNPPEWTVEEILEFPGSVNGAWARYVVKPATHGIGTVRYPRLEPRDADCAAKLKDRTLTKLYNERPAWLDLAHKKLDAAVVAAYGWPADLTDEQILEKLLALNLERAAEEAKAAKVKKPKTTREKNTDEMI